jgi:uncharacterized protein (TIGR02246 family)
MSGFEGSSEDRASLETLLREEQDAWNDGDAAAFAARVHPEVVFTNIVGMFSVGKTPFEAQHARIFSTMYKGSTLKQTIVHLFFVRPDVAIVDTLTEVTGFKNLPPGSEAVDGVLRTRLEQVCVRNGGDWWVAAFHNVVVNPAILSGAAPPS